MSERLTTDRSANPSAWESQDVYPDTASPLLTIERGELPSIQGRAFFPTSTWEKVAYIALHILFFPLGIHRLTQLFILPSTLPPFGASITTRVTQAVFSFFNNRIITTTPCEITLPDGNTLRGYDFQAHHSEIPEIKQWVVCFGGNGQEIITDRQITDLAYLSANILTNVRSVDYRGAGLSDGSYPTQAQAAKDGCAIVQDLIDRGVKPEEIIIQGLSLGGSIAARVAAEFPDSRLCCINTFSSIPTIAESILQDVAYTLDDIFYTNITSDSRCASGLRAFAFLTLAPAGFALKMTHFVLSLLENMIRFDAMGVAYDLKNLTFFPLFYFSLTALYAMQLFSAPFTTLPSKLLAEIGKRAFKSPAEGRSWKFAPITESLLSSKLAKAATWLLLRLVGWYESTKPYWDKVTGDKIVFFSPNDQVIPYEASLAKVVELGKRVEQHPNSDHCSLPLIPHPSLDRYVAFLYPGACQ